MFLGKWIGRESVRWFRWIPESRKTISVKSSIRVISESLFSLRMTDDQHEQDSQGERVKHPKCFQQATSINSRLTRCLNFSSSSRAIISVVIYFQSRADSDKFTSAERVSPLPMNVTRAVQLFKIFSSGDANGTHQMTSSSHIERCFHRAATLLPRLLLFVT